MYWDSYETRLTFAKPTDTFTRRRVPNMASRKNTAQCNDRSHHNTYMISFCSSVFFREAMFGARRRSERSRGQDNAHIGCTRPRTHHHPRKPRAPGRRGERVKTQTNHQNTRNQTKTQQNQKHQLSHLTTILQIESTSASRGHECTHAHTHTHAHTTCLCRSCVNDPQKRMH